MDKGKNRVYTAPSFVKRLEGKTLRVAKEEAESKLIVIGIMERYQERLKSLEPSSEEQKIVAAEYKALTKLIGRLPKRSVAEKNLLALTSMS